MAAEYCAGDSPTPWHERFHAGSMLAQVEESGFRNVWATSESTHALVVLSVNRELRALLCRQGGAGNNLPGRLVVTLFFVKWSGCGVVGIS